MLAELIQVLGGLQLNLRPADMVDIALIATAIYFAMSWVWRRISKSIAIGSVVLLTAYLVASWLHLYMTSILFKVGLPVVVFGFLLIFQDDIRRLFEHFRMWGARLGRGEEGLTVTSSLDDIVEATTQMAEERVGALVVLRGEESMSVHTHGGVDLGGAVSVPLLLSLFDPKTAGHDGAAIVNGGLVERFAVHLPLSTDAAQLGVGGTRHAAALGLAERTDAMVLVVSEERGTISLAHEGRLEVIDQRAELKARLEAFCGAGDEEARRRRWRRILRENWGMKGASVVMATALWFVFAHQVATVQRTFDVPIAYRNLPPMLAMDHDHPSRVSVQLRGPERAFEALDERNLQVAIDMSDVRSGSHQMVVSKRRLRIPPELSVEAIDPSHIGLRVFEMVEARLPVDVQTSGEPPPGIAITRTSAAPAFVEVYVRKDRRSSVLSMPTEPIDVGDITQTTSISTTLVPNADVRLGPRVTGEVVVRVVVERRKKAL